jgi:hypothetical protein
LYVATSATDGIVWKSTNSADTWIMTGLASLHATALAVDPLTAATLYAAGVGELYRSTNSGNDWSAINSGLTEVTITAIVIHPSTTSTIYLATNGGVYKTINSGTTWTAVNVGITNLDLRSLAINASTPATLMAGSSGGGIDPEWVEDGEQMLGGTEGTEPGNRVETHIDTQFGGEHTTAGVHTASPLEGVMLIETGQFSGTGAKQTITLNEPDLEILELWIIESGTGRVYSRVKSFDDLGNFGTAFVEEPYYEDRAARGFISLTIWALNTGSFEVENLPLTHLTPPVTYYYCALGKYTLP